MLTHHNLVSNICQVEGTRGVDTTKPGDVVIGVLPFFHIYGMVVIMNMTLITGATVVTVPRFDMEEFLQTIEKYRVTRASLVPPIVLGLTKHPVVDQYDTSSLVHIGSGAAPLGEEISLACGTRLGCLLTQGYGLTETSPVTHTNPYDAKKLKHGSAGLTVPNTETKIVDLETGQALGFDQRGEVCIRGPQVMKGYLNNPQATEHCIDNEGWFHTGDIGYFDKDEFLFVVDRLKELIKYKGFQVAPAELEALLLSHPEITDAAVIPSPDDEAGELPKAFIVAKDNLSEQQVMDFVAQSVSPQKKVRLVEFIDEIPKSLSGKILRRVLVDRERERVAS
jgi:acyl-CoA synthetase (AMP-forming)/AMP-acid ligase II